MKLNLKTLQYFLLTCGSKKRNDHFDENFKKYNVIKVNPVMGIQKYKSASTGVSRILDYGASLQKNGEPFVPFGLFEDDIRRTMDFPKKINIPDDADILYIGLSWCGSAKDQTGKPETVRYRGINDKIIKLHNMLSLHGLIICSLRGLLLMQTSMVDAYYTETIWDVPVAKKHMYYNIYGLRDPIVYQYGEIGGQEDPTKIKHMKEEERIPNEWITKLEDKLFILDKKVKI